ncbi:kinase-like domain-containing protein [Aspergillus pseudonomiae]|uniref:EKC/KEOPS complex subunit BUD32 n=1 Tax=Aspergillus pseudonomiae TaxID=1506151 RepID=A0A5N6I2F7_9EURO|nr:kinase-like domain-containing protein [Aspergillus pseudonomiae]KAB8259939.1 kinase-like domain-containing protein [Aspergillus pseudonomiae]KAE8407774.1 kinase-like domain-containing protein [Aspergillus pseudonomiae]
MSSTRCGHLPKRDSLAATKNDVSGSNEEHQTALPGKTADRVFYEPHLNEILSGGSTSLIARLKPGVVLKYPRYSWWHAEAADRHPFVKDIKQSFEVEKRILDILGAHPRIIRYIGVLEEPRGLLFGEASDGDLQTYIDQYHDNIDECLRLKWCIQAAEAVHYIHQKGVIHSDLRPDNFLLHSDSNYRLDLLLCDFGGSTCGDIDGGHLPDSGFFNPCWPWVSTEAVDIFSLGSIFYTIMTGHWPYRSPGPFKSLEEKIDYGEMVDGLFASRTYPPVDGLLGGAVIQGCWTERYSDAGALIQDQACLSAR